MGVEEDCVCSTPKLFVGQIPSDVTRETLLSLFERFAHVHRIDMLTPRQLNVATRSAMVWFDTWSDVERILEVAEADSESGAAVDRFHLGGPKRLVIRIADPPKRGDNCLGIKPKKLFIGQIPREVKDVDVRQLFGQFGVIDEFEVPKRLSVVSCAFVRFRKWSQAEDAIHALNEQYTFDQSKRALVVKFADAKMTEAPKSQMIGEKRPLTPEDRCDLIKRQYSDEGEERKVDPLDLGYLSSRMGMPMGLGTFTGMGRIEWVQEESRRFLKDVNGATVGMMWISQMANPGSAVMPAGDLNLPSTPSQSPMAGQTLVPLVQNGQHVIASSHSLPPVGANGKLGKGFSDPKVKEWTLFVGQIPHQADEYALWEIFRPFGEILELNVLRKDGKHRGCAFVTYERREMSLAAIEKLNGIAFPWDANQRKLVVRLREKSSKN